MLLSLSYRLLQVLSYLVLHAKTLVVTLDSTFLLSRQKTHLWSISEFSEKELGLPLKNFPSQKQPKLGPTHLFCVFLLHIRGIRGSTHCSSCVKQEKGS